jgi:hypothetical protein
MLTIAEAFTEIVRLIGDTFRLWWKNFVPLVTWFLAGNVVFIAATQAAVWLRIHQHATLAIGLFSFGALAQLVAIVGMIRTIAGSLYRWRDAAAGPGETIDPTQQRLLELLALTLLPLVAVWSAWGYLDDAVNVYTSTFYTIKGTFEPPFKFGGGEWKNYLPAILVLLVVRRIVEWFDGRWPNRAVKLFQVWVEAFFILLVFIITVPAIQSGKNWLSERRFWISVTDIWDAVKSWFAGIKIPIPDGLEWLWGVFSETLWPLFTAGVAQPLTWLAITTVVFGHRALSAAGVVRGTRLESRIGSSGGATNRGRVAAMANRAPDLVLAGFKEKFLPTLNAFRLLVGVGPVFLGVVCVVYSLHDIAFNWFDVGMGRLIGDRGSNFTILWGNLIALAQGALFEPLRIALLAAAFDQAISVGLQKRSEAAERKRADQPAAPEPVSA